MFALPLRRLVPLKRLLARGALALLLVFAQQQALLHWLSHAIEATHAKEGGPLPSDHCAECVALGALGAAATGRHTLPVVPAHHDALAPYAPVASAAAALLLAFRSRAPPVLL